MAQTRAAAYQDNIASPLEDPVAFDPITIITVDNASEAATLRTSLRNLLWGSGNYPSNQPTITTTTETNPNALRIDKITVSMNFGLQSIGRLYIPLPGPDNNRLFILHGGHGHNLTYFADHINTLLQQGYRVAVFCMPNEGENASVVIDDAHYGQFTLSEHASYNQLHPAAGHPLKYFLEPVVVFLNWAALQGYSMIVMSGLSGGGWTTTLMAALDTRIKYSFPVAGSLPMYLRNGDFGDWEQSVSAVYEVADYLDLYVMACDNRRQMQVLNYYDTCCFQSHRANYQTAVQTKATACGGTWAFLSDTTHTSHIISSWAMGQIITQINTWG